MVYTRQYFKLPHERPHDHWDTQNALESNKHQVINNAFVSLLMVGSLSRGDNANWLEGMQYKSLQLYVSNIDFCQRKDIG